MKYFFSKKFLIGVSSGDRRFFRSWYLGFSSRCSRIFRIFEFLSLGSGIFISELNFFPVLGIFIPTIEDYSDQGVLVPEIENFVESRDLRFSYRNFPGFEFFQGIGLFSNLKILSQRLRVLKYRDRDYSDFKIFKPGIGECIRPGYFHPRVREFFWS